MAASFTDVRVCAHDFEDGRCNHCRVPQRDWESGSWMFRYMGGNNRAADQQPRGRGDTFAHA